MQALLVRSTMAVEQVILLGETVDESALAQLAQAAQTRGCSVQLVEPIDVANSTALACMRLRHNQASVDATDDCFRLVRLVEVVSQQPFSGDEDLADLAREMDVGGDSGTTFDLLNERVPPAQMAPMLQAHGSDPSFFGLNAPEGASSDDCT